MSIFIGGKHCHSDRAEGTQCHPDRSGMTGERKELGMAAPFFKRQTLELSIVSPELQKKKPDFLCQNSF